jgi:hypothetical protein
MPIVLPRLGKTLCSALTVCGYIRELKHPMVSVLPEKDAWVAAYQGENEKVFIRILPGGNKHTHLHVDCFSKKFFDEKRIPKTNITKNKLLSVLEKAIGLTLDAEIYGGFIVPLTDLPESGLIRSLFTEHKTADMSVQLTSGECKIEGTPVRSMSWTIKGDRKNVHIGIEASREEKVDEQYLVRTLEWIEKQFALFILGKTVNENP